MTRTGTVKMNGSVIGYIEEIITIDHRLMEAKIDQGDIVPFTDDDFDDVSSSSKRAEGTDTGKAFHHHGIGHSRPSHAPHKNRHHFPGHVHHPAPGRHHHPGHDKPRGDADPDFKYNATGAGHPFDRARFAKELEAKPWLKEKIKHISLGENQDPTANTAVIETMMNRAAVRGTSLEQQAKRHRSSGVDEGGYYAGYASGYTADKGAMADRNIAAALRGSNVTNYATDNSSGNLAAREIASGAFRHHKTINGESFFSPGSAEPAFRDRWQSMKKRAQEHEQTKQSTMPTQTEPM